MESLIISIHVLRVEDDTYNNYSQYTIDISIHVLRVEDDSKVKSLRLPDRYFNPRPPCGGRPG